MTPEAYFQRKTAAIVVAIAAWKYSCLFSCLFGCLFGYLFGNLYNVFACSVFVIVGDGVSRCLSVRLAPDLPLLLRLDQCSKHCIANPTKGM